MKINEEYSKLARGNIANILSFYHEKNEEIPKKLLASLNFFEEFENIFHIPNKPKEGRQHISESHALNCMKNLDFKVYSKYMDVNWIYNSGIKNNISFIRTALIYNKKEALNYSLELINKEIEEGVKVKDLGSREMETMFFRDMVDLTSILRINRDSMGSSEDLEFKYDLFKKSIKSFNKFYNDRALIWKSNNNVDFTSWHRNHDRLKIFFSNFNNADSLTEELVSNKGNFFICKDAFAQYSSEEFNPFVTDYNILLAMKSGNTNFLNLLYKNKSVSSEALVRNYNDFLKVLLERFKKDIYSDYSEDVSFPSFKLIKQIDSFLKKNKIIPKYDSESILSLFCCDNIEVKSFLIENIPNVEKIKIKDNLSLEQLSFVNKYITSLRSEKVENKSKTRKITEKDLFESKFPTFEIYLTDKAFNMFSEVKLSGEDKMLAIEKIADKNHVYLDGVSMTKEQISSILNKEFLEDSMLKNESDNKRKLKV